MKNSKKTSTNLSKFIPLLIIVFVVCTFFWRVFVYKEVPLPGDFIVGVYHPWLDYKWGYPAGVPVKNPITTDVVSFTYPMQTLAMSLLKSGIWPLWNPYILTGTTLLADFQSAPFAPTRIVYFLFNTVTAWSADVILQFVLAGVFTYLLLRHWKVSKLASIFGSIVFAFSGYNLIFSEWNGHTLAAAFIPLVLLFTDRLLHRGRYWDGFGLSIVLALQLFSGYTQTSVYTAVAVGILWLTSIIGAKKWKSKTLVLGIFCFFGVLLSAVQILPGVELIKYSQRAFEPHPFEWTFLPWKKTITFIAADYFGNHATGNYWGPQDYTSNTGYVGVVAFSLAIYAILSIKKRREVLFSLILAIISLILSYPTPVSIFIWSKNVFGMQANSAHRATVLFCTSVAFLASFGFDEITKQKRNFVTVLKIVISILPQYLLIGVFALFSLYLFKINIGIKNLIFPLLILLGVSATFFLPKKFSRYLLVVLVIIELFRFGWKFEPISPNQFTYPTTPILTYLQSQQKPFRTTGAKVIPSNLRMAYGIESTEGYDTFHPLDVSEFIAAINSGSTSSLTVGRYGIVDNDVSPLLDLVNTKYYLALKTDPDIKRFDSSRFKIVFEDKSVEIFESRTALPRAFMVYDWEINRPSYENDLTNLNKMLQKDFPFDKKILLNENTSFVPLTNLKTVPDNTVLYKNYQNQESTIEVNTSSDGLLFVSDSYYPGWKVFVDGIENKIYKADFAFRAIEIHKGKHEVSMVYEPDSFYFGLKISLVSLILLVGVGIVVRLYFT